MPENKSVIPPFGVEISTPKNSDVVICSIPGCRLRGAVKARATVRMQPGCPEIPGQQLHVNPAKLQYKIIDPLNDKKNAALCLHIAKVMANSPIVDADMGTTVCGIEDIEGTLNVDAMKNLCRELVHLLGSNDATMVKGPEPTMKDVEDLPGRYLLDPSGIASHYTQPTYEDQVEEFRLQLAGVRK